MPAIFTNAGKAAFALNHVDGTPVIIDEIRIGIQGNGYTPTADQTGLRNGATGQVVLAVTGMNLTSSGPRVSVEYETPSGAAIRAIEIGYYRQGVLYAIWSEPGRALFVQDAEASTLFSFVFEYRDGVPNSLSITQSSFTFAYASEAEAQAAEASAVRDKIMSPWAVWRWFANLSIPADKLTGTLNSDRLGDNSIERRHIRDGAVNADKVADATLTGDKIADDQITGSKLSVDATMLERIQDIVGGMLSGNTEKGAALSYNDNASAGAGNGKVDLSVTYASSTEINTGTEDEKAVNPKELRGSQYRQITHGTGAAPAASAARVGSIYLRYDA